MRRHDSGTAARLTIALTAWAAAICSGCVVGGRTNLAAADTIDVVVESLAQSLGEYHEEIAAADEARRRRAVDALIARIKADGENEERSAVHRAAFIEVLQRLGHDEHIEWQRYTTALDHLTILRKIGDGLRRMARESASLDDEFRRHLMSLFKRASRGRPKDEALKR